MKLFEYDAKDLASAIGIPVPKGFVARSSEEATAAYEKISKPVMLKAQVLVAGRGKAGGIKPASSAKEAFDFGSALLGMDIKGERVKSILVEEKLEITRELYVGFVVDRAAGCYTILASAEGGVDIEELATSSPEKIIKAEINPSRNPDEFFFREVAARLGYAGKQLVDLSSVVSKLYALTVQYDAELCESNPLIQRRDGSFVAGDLRMIIDDNSLYRHPQFLRKIEELQAELSPLEVKAREKGLAYVELDGEIGIIGNGAGLVMATVDMISDYGGKPANFCDVGGGAGKERIAAAIETVLLNQKVRVLLINIMGGITRCDDVARAILEIRESMGIEQRLVIRLVGTNEEEGRRILEEAKIPFLDSMEEAAERTVSLVKG